MDPEAELTDTEFRKIQLRVIKKYCKHHPELSETVACMIWIRRCASRFREYYENIQSHSSRNYRIKNRNN